MFPGMIVFWFGEIVNIPYGWHQCDGTNGTPDLRDKIPVSVGLIFQPGFNFDEYTHRHAALALQHTHQIQAGVQISFPIPAYSGVSQYNDPQILTDFAEQLPPYYCLTPIMKL